MAEASDPVAGPPTLGEALAWVGFSLDGSGDSGIGRIHGIYVDATSGEPTWLIAALGRRRTRKRVAIPVGDCAGGGGRVWIAHERDAVRSAPIVDPERPLQREHELTICSHYGIGERIGRAAEVSGRPEGAVTSEPA